MTLDKLAVITQQGFLEVNEKMDKKFAVVEKRLDGVENEIRSMKENSSELFTKLDRFIALYEKQEKEMLLLGAHHRRLEERVAKLELKK